MTTFKELKEIENFKDYAAVEVYMPTFNNNDLKSYDFHSDFVDFIENADDNAEVLRWQEFDEEEYNRKLNANTGHSDDFAELYGDKNATVLVVLISKGSIDD